MKLLFVVHDYLPEHVGGTEVHTHRLACELARRGHAVTVAYTERDVARAVGEMRFGELDGVRTVEVVHQREYAQPCEQWSEPRGLEAFARVCAATEPDVVHFQHFATWGSSCVGEARRAARAVVFTAHDFHLMCANARAMRDDGDLCLGNDGGREPDCAHCTAGDARAASARREHQREQIAQLDRVIAPSRFMARVLVQGAWAQPDRIAVIPPGVQTGAAAPEQPREARPLRVGFVGGLFPAKGAHVLIDALRLASGDGIELHVHGVLEWFPDYVERLRHAARGLPVRFHGRFEPREHARILAGLDLLAVPSLWYENAPLVIAEAFACSVPVLASNLGGMAESVRHDVDGWLVPRGDAAAWSQALTALATDRELLARLRRGIRPPLSLPEVAERTLALYRECGA